MSMIKTFQDFAIRGNVVDLAVGIYPLCIAITLLRFRARVHAYQERDKGECDCTGSPVLNMSG